MLTRILFTSFLIALISACGGSDDNSSDDNNNTAASIPITSDNAVELAATVTESTLNNGAVWDSEDLFDVFSGLLIQQTNSKSGLEYSDLMKFALEQIPVAGAGTDVTLECQLSGSLNISGSIADQSTLSTGDSLTIAFDACVSEEGSQNGSISITITAFSGDVGTDYSIGFSVVFNDLIFIENNETTTISGDVSMSIMLAEGILTTSFESNAFTVNEDGREQSISDYSVVTTVDVNEDSFNLDLEGSLTSDELGGTVSFETIEPFTGTGDDELASGVLRITGADGSTMTLTTENGVDVLLEIDSDGDGETNTTVDSNWEELEEFFDD